MSSDDLTMGLPSAFCWTKFGTEAGESVDEIFARKEIERQRNEGIFLWGIGNSVGPSMLELVDLVVEPTVIFTPIVSQPRPSDAAPAAVVSWRSAIGLDGSEYSLPSHSIVTSSAGVGASKERHYALVCSRQVPIGDAEGGWIDSRGVRNLRTGRPVEIGRAHV